VHGGFNLGDRVATRFQVTYRVLVTGSRTWRDEQVIREVLDELLQAHPNLTVVHGACPRGADAIAHQWAIERARQGATVTVEAHPADWGRYKRAAGSRRNAAMVALGGDICLAFIRGDSHGATDCARRADLAGIPVRRWVS